MYGISVSVTPGKGVGDNRSGQEDQGRVQSASAALYLPSSLEMPPVYPLQKS